MTDEITEQVIEVLEATKPSKNTTSTREMAKYIRKALGAELASMLIGADQSLMMKWINGKTNPSLVHTRLVQAAHELTSTLFESMSASDAKLWLVSHSTYLYGVPAIEFKKHSNDVLVAALNLITRGEPEDHID